MPIPSIEALLLPFLRVVSDGQEHSVEETRYALADQFKLTEEEKTAKKNPESTTPIFTNNVAWAKVHLGEAHLLDGSKGPFKISSKGQECLASNPSKLTLEDLKRWSSSESAQTVPTKREDAVYGEINTLADSRFEQLCNATFLPQTLFQDFEKLLLAKKQVILEGAPGTGKTFVAEMFANWFAGSDQRVKVIQFHESYGYEDFVYGIKPSYDPATNSSAFRDRPGVFLKFCESARQEEESRFVMVIDEVNRGKPARIFGELLYLLEYRKKTVELQSGITFGIPENVYLIGTMNTVDKSIALVDYALRRRFSFLTLKAIDKANGDTRSVVLRSWMDSKKIRNADEVERLFIALNNLVADKDEALTIGHSYFMSKDAQEAGEFTPELLDFIWKYNILPLVNEYEYELKAAEVETRYGLESVKRQAGL
jgi:5-methylcytosine-specific restriction endonuclease McrBC GTP-binding regulatory subunit McrB